MIDGNKRPALIAFYGLNGRRLTLTNDAAYELVINVAAGQLDTVDEITPSSIRRQNLEEDRDKTTNSLGERPI